MELHHLTAYLSAKIARLFPDNHKDEFEATADAFFAQPLQSIRGWEPAADAQIRIVGAVEQALSRTPEGMDIAIVGHGGTGTLLYCHLAGLPIDRRYDQPATNGGNWFAFDRVSRKLLCDGWQSINTAAGQSHDPARPTQQHQRSSLSPNQ